MADSAEQTGRRDAAPGTAPAATPALGLKRALVPPAVVLTVLEVLVVAWPLLQAIDPTPEQRAVLARAVAPVVGGALVLWFAALASWLSPVQRAVRARRRGETIEAKTAEAAYRALGRIPLRALWLRTVLWVAAATGVGLLLAGRAALPQERVLALASMAGLYGFVVNVVRAGWYARIFGRLQGLLFPSVEPLRQFADRYFRRLVLVALLVGAGAVAGLVAFVYYFLPIKPEQYLQVQTHLPGVVAAMTAAWYLYARSAARPIDAYLRVQLEGERRYDMTADLPTVRAYRCAQTLPYRLAAAKVLAWTIGTAIVAVIARRYNRMELDNAVLMFGTAVVMIIGSAIYEAVWHRDTMRPLLSHMPLRHRLPGRDIRATLSLRGKLLISFGGLVLFACGLSLLWGFVQYKRLASNFVHTQAQLKLDWVRSEVLGSIKQKDAEPSGESVWKVLVDAGLGSSADEAVYVYVPPRFGAARVAGGGLEGAPGVPWYVLARLRAGGYGGLEVDSLRLSGVHGQLAVDWRGRRVELGSVAVLYPGWRGRGPGMQRPLKELVVFFLVLLGACAGIVVLTVGDFTTPIRRLEQRADEMAHGELSRPVTPAGEGDEVGRLTMAIEEMRRALRDKLRSTEEVNLDLEREVQRRTADLAKKNRELAEALEKLTRAQSQLIRSEKMASIGQLVAGIAHEINNPVNAIVNTVSPLSDSIEQIVAAADTRQVQLAADEVLDMVKVIQRGARRTRDIVQALHNYSRTDDERLVEFDLNRGLEDSLELLRHELKKTVTVERRYAEVGRIRGHAGQLNQVFMNLLTNAAQAVSGRDHARIILETQRRGEQVVIRVSDNGGGIPPEVLPRIFDPFFTTKEVGQGSGLGLSIVHGIVERHGGTIEVDSKVDRGTTFTVTLPVTQPGPGPSNA